MRMRTTVVTLALSLIFSLPALAACSDETTDKGEKSPTPPPVETPIPMPTPTPSPEPPDPVIESPMLDPQTQTPLTYEDAMEVCKAWLERDWNFTPYTIYDMSVPGYPVPPTYYLLGEHYYEFYVTYHLVYTSDVSHHILIHEKTGELLSLSQTINDGGHRVLTLESLEDWWYAGGCECECDEIESALLSVNEALDVYYARIDVLPDDLIHFSDVRLDRRSYGFYVVFGEKYYYFKAEEDQMYWFNILVHADTGELLFMTSHDGMYGGTDIEPLEDVLDRW